LELTRSCDRRRRAVYWSEHAGNGTLPFSTTLESHGSGNGANSKCECLYWVAWVLAYTSAFAVCITCDRLDLPTSEMSNAVSLQLPGIYHFRGRVVDYFPPRLEDWITAKCSACGEWFVVIFLLPRPLTDSSLIVQPRPRTRALP
jgi:hypothetical protein